MHVGSPHPLRRLFAFYEKLRQLCVRRFQNTVWEYRFIRSSTDGGAVGMHLERLMAADAESALAQASDQAPTLRLVDVRMPKVDRVLEAMTAGASDYMAKPFSLQQLLA